MDQVNHVYMCFFPSVLTMHIFFTALLDKDSCIAGKSKFQQNSPTYSHFHYLNMKHSLMLFLEWEHEHKKCNFHKRLYMSSLGRRYVILNINTSFLITLYVDLKISSNCLWAADTIKLKDRKWTALNYLKLKVRPGFIFIW